MDQDCREEEMSSLFCFLLGHLPSLKLSDQEVKKPSRRGLKSSIEILAVSRCWGNKNRHPGAGKADRVPINTARSPLEFLQGVSQGRR